MEIMKRFAFIKIRKVIREFRQAEYLKNFFNFVPAAIWIAVYLLSRPVLILIQPINPASCSPIFVACKMKKASRSITESFLQFGYAVISPLFCIARAR